MLPSSSLLLLPIGIYAASYLYLASYHGRLFIFNTVIHEGGTYTLFQTMLYASHFLGHIPVHTTIACLFIGSYLCLIPQSRLLCARPNISSLVSLLIIFLILTFIISIAFFGFRDTLAFVSQQKQNMTVYTRGGSWNLHLPSTMLLCLCIPPYVFLFRTLLGRSSQFSSRGLFLLAAGAGLILFFTFLFNGQIGTVIASVWSDPRYLAHSVREIMTFPLTYFPFPLYYLIREEPPDSIPKSKHAFRSFPMPLAVMSAIFLGAFLYQVWMPLTAGIGELAQKPFFAKGGRLGIPYLLASHYFEHILDTIYFSLLCLILYKSACVILQKAHKH